MKATIKENKKAIKFLRNAAFLPIYFDSRGYVITPTNVRVDISAATCEIPAPFCNSMLPVEKATKVGITVIEPIREERPTPKNPESFPIKADIVSGFNIANINPTTIIMLKNCGIIFSKDLTAVLRATIVFFLSFIKDKPSNDIDNIYKI